jgi:hypothetical protein
VVVIADTPTFHFVPSNPWVGVNWRKPEDIKVPLEPVFKRKKSPSSSKKSPVSNRNKTNWNWQMAAASLTII